jgi:hypothetical protein
VWARQRLWNCGYQVDARCQLCNLEEDTVFHRVWQRRATKVVEARLAVTATARVRHRRARMQQPYRCAAYSRRPRSCEVVLLVCLEPRKGAVPVVP